MLHRAKHGSQYRPPNCVNSEKVQESANRLVEFPGVVDRMGSGGEPCKRYNQSVIQGLSDPLRTIDQHPS